jgi:hypothetical protein
MAKNSVKKLKKVRVAAHDSSRKKKPAATGRAGQAWERGESVPLAADTSEKVVSNK